MQWVCIRQRAWEPHGSSHVSVFVTRKPPRRAGQMRVDRKQNSILTRIGLFIHEAIFFRKMLTSRKLVQHSRNINNQTSISCYVTTREYLQDCRAPSMSKRTPLMSLRGGTRCRGEPSIAPVAGIAGTARLVLGRRAVTRRLALPAHFVAKMAEICRHWNQTTSQNEAKSRVPQLVQT